MRIYDPQKATTILREVMKELYLLKQAVEYQQLSVGFRTQLVAKIRAKIAEALELVEKEEKPIEENNSRQPKHNQTKPQDWRKTTSFDSEIIRKKEEDW